MSEWRPIETARRDGRAIILWGPRWHEPLVGKFYTPHNPWIHHPGDHPFTDKPTLWQPLPRTPPELEMLAKLREAYGVSTDREVLERALNLALETARHADR